jgi:hypothetical protein
MKKLLVLLFSIGLALSVSAQRGGHIGGHFGGGLYYGGPRVIVGFGGYAPYYPFGYYPYYPYGPYGYGYGYPVRPSRLTMQIEDIKADYRDKIASAKEDKSLSHKQRREKVRELKNQREDAIENARRNYYKY